MQRSSQAARGAFFLRVVVRAGGQRAGPRVSDVSLPGNCSSEEVQLQSIQSVTDSRVGATASSPRRRLGGTERRRLAVESEHLLNSLPAPFIHSFTRSLSHSFILSFFSPFPVLSSDDEGPRVSLICRGTIQGKW